MWVWKCLRLFFLSMVRVGDSSGVCCLRLSWCSCCLICLVFVNRLLLWFGCFGVVLWNSGS